MAFAEGKKKFTDALDNDLNTSLAVTALYDVFKLKTNGKTKLALVADFDKVLGIGLVEARARALEAKKEEKSEDTPEVSPEMLAYINEMISLIGMQNSALASWARSQERMRSAQAFIAG